MDAIFSPYITIAANLIVGLLISKGIIDNSSKQVVYQAVSNALAALVTIVLGVYSIYISHKIHMAKNPGITKAVDGTVTIPVLGTVGTTSSTATTQPIQQTGLPLTPTNA